MFCVVLWLVWWEREGEGERKTLSLHGNMLLLNSYFFMILILKISISVLKWAVIQGCYWIFWVCTHTPEKILNVIMLRSGLPLQIGWFLFFNWKIHLSFEIVLDSLIKSRFCNYGFLNVLNLTRLRNVIWVMLQPYFLFRTGQTGKALVPHLYSIRALFIISSDASPQISVHRSCTWDSIYMARAPFPPTFPGTLITRK